MWTLFLQQFSYWTEILCLRAHIIFSRSVSHIPQCTSPIPQDKISSSLKKSSKHFILAKFEMVSGLYLLSLQTGPLRYSVHRFVEPSLFSHVLDAEHSGRRDIITSSKGFVIIHVLLDIVESNALFFKSTWIWVSKWGASSLKHKHSFTLSSWIGKGLRDGGSLLRVSTVYVRPSITSLSALGETFPLNDSIVRACRNTGKSIHRFCSISSGKSSAMNKLDPFKFPFFEQMLSRSLIENLAIIGLFWPLTYIPFRWHFNICIFFNSG